MGISRVAECPSGVWFSLLLNSFAPQGANYQFSRALWDNSKKSGKRIKKTDWAILEILIFKSS